MLDRTGAFDGGCASSSGMQMTNTYSVNHLITGDGTYPYGDYNATSSPISQSSINQVANTVLLLLSNSLPPYGRSWGCIYTTLEASDFINKIRLRAIHNDGGNLGFADGHSKYYQMPAADAANDGPSGKPGSGSGPRCTIFTWKSRNMWTVPSMPDSNVWGGYTFVNDGDPAGGCPVE
ncbi:hypothetical protein EON82_12965 [bacterium]|nr:MAG: hypothetical protein EON82_12965 [bacterium]